MRLAALILVAAALAGCGDRAAIQEGGEVPGDTVTVYLLVSGQDRQLVRGAKLALFEAGGRAGEVTVQIATAAYEGPDTVEEVVRDVNTIAVVTDGDERVVAPLLNAVGILHVSLAPATSTAQPAARRTYFPLRADGREAMDAVLAALREAGEDATLRAAVVEAFANRH